MKFPDDTPASLSTVNLEAGRPSIALGKRADVPLHCHICLQHASCLYIVFDTGMRVSPSSTLPSRA